MNYYLRLSLLAAAAVLTSGKAAAQLTVTLTPSVASPGLVGSLVTFTAASSVANANVWYRFRVRPAGGGYQTVRDYSPITTLDWSATKHEGQYEVQVLARNLDTQEQASTSTLFDYQSRVTGDQPVISPTANTLVFLYSAPACGADAHMRVQFSSDSGPSTLTPSQPCQPGASMNFFLAGLQPNRTYTAHHILASGTSTGTGAPISFTTGSAPAGLYTDQILVPSKTANAEQILLGGPVGDRPVANDLQGNVLWYGPPTITFFTRIESGGEFWGIFEAPGSDRTRQIVRKFDLAGMTLLETNAARVSEQLVAMGKREITGFHHEARSLSDGRIVVLAGVEQILTDVQGPGPLDVLGDMIVVLDKNLNVVWSWDTFDNLDVTRTALLSETCPNAGCPAYYLAPVANDWTHGNAVQETADGNFLLSVRNQDWLIKIAYDAGNGGGHIIWRLGHDGDFSIDSGDLYPWFSHQHDGNFDTVDPTKLLVFDDGNSRIAQLQRGNSRGQVLQIDEPNRTAKLLLNADLGEYAAAVGSAQPLKDGNYHFNVGFVQENNTIDSYSIEVDGTGSVQYEAHQNVILYRTFRIADLYTPY